VWPAIHACTPAQGAHADTFRRASIHLHSLCQDLCLLTGTQAAHDHTHRREEIHMRRLQVGLAVVAVQRRFQHNLGPLKHTRPFNGPFSGTTRVRRYQKGETNLYFTGARDNEWQWHQLGCMQVCTSLQTDNDASTPPLSFLQARCPSCCPTNSVKALKAI